MGGKRLIFIILKFMGGRYNKNIEFISHIIKIIIETHPLSNINDILKIIKEKYHVLMVSYYQ